MAIVTIDSKRCGRDGICIAECPMDLLAANHLPPARRVHQRSDSALLGLAEGQRQAFVAEHNAVRLVLDARRLCPRHGGLESRDQDPEW